MGEFEEPRLDDLVMPISDLDKMKAHLSEKVRLTDLNGNLFEDEKTKARSLLDDLENICRGEV
jgi:hypothetical protein